MAWTSMHFATGMLGTAAITTAATLCLPVLRRCIFRKDRNHLPLLLTSTMTLGGIFACGPDLPRLFREDFPSLPFAATLGNKDFERYLHSMGDLFFFHASLDAQPKEYALHGVILIITLYNLSLLTAYLRKPMFPALICSKLKSSRSTSPQHSMPS